MSEFTSCDKCDECGGEKTYSNQVCMPINGKLRNIDWCIHQIVAALNAGGIETVACCCGHGEQDGRIDLSDGRVLIIKTGSHENLLANVLAESDCDIAALDKDQTKAKGKQKMHNLTIVPILKEIDTEYTNAITKFPSSTLSVAALMEEVGELAKAMLEEPLENVRKEAVQVAVMAIRVAIEGDDTFNAYRKQNGLDRHGAEK